MQRQLLIITATMLTIGTVLSSESGYNSATMAAPAGQEFAYTAPLQCIESKALFADFSLHNREPNVLTLGLKTGDGRARNTHNQLELDAGKLGLAMEIAAQRLIGSQQSYSF